MAISIELAIVIVGVFIGMWVANWNQERLEKAETRRMLEQLRPELQSKLKTFRIIRNYYAVTRRFADQALAGWDRDPRVSDSQFVIDAYQSSQILGISMNADAWSAIFGSAQLRDIDDTDLRRSLTAVLTSDYQPMVYTAMATPYRQHVREVIPSAVQDEIRAACGDSITSQPAGGGDVYVLPPTCPLKLDPAIAKRTAASLRAQPELVGELNWHVATIATYLGNCQRLENRMRKLQGLLDKKG